MMQIDRRYLLNAGSSLLGFRGFDATGAGCGVCGLDDRPYGIAWPR
jgi:hypothetical protein